MYENVLLSKPVWSDWVEGECSVTCGTGTRTDTRTCTQGNCDGDASRTQSCEKPECPRKSEVEM